MQDDKFNSGFDHGILDARSGRVNRCAWDEHADKNPAVQSFWRAYRKAIYVARAAGVVVR